MVKISVIIPFKNSNSDINKVIYSALNQNFCDFQILVITDKNLDLNENNQIRIFKVNKKFNIPQCMNWGVKHADGQYVCFLCPNDLLLYNALKLRLIEFQKNANLVAAYGFGIDTDLNYQVKCNLNYEYFTRENVDLPDNSIQAVLSGDINMSMSSLMLKKEIFDCIQFNPYLKTTYVWEFFIKLFSVYEGKICQISEPIYISSENDSNLLCNNQKYFIDYLKEASYVLDNFVINSGEIKYFNNLKIQCFKNLYSHLFFVLVEYFPYNFWLRFYLLISYLKKNQEFQNKLMDFCFLAILINSVNISTKHFQSAQTVL